MHDNNQPDDDYQPQPPNLDLIQMVQNARMMHDKDATPSQSAANYWIESKPLQENVPAPTARTGQWIIKTSLDNVDAHWQTIKTATEKGELGYKSKVATSARDIKEGQNMRVILIRTYDADDLADVQRVQQALQALGFQPERYERD